MTLSAQFTTYRIKQGDSLEAIAGQFLGDPTRWLELAAINRLRAPYISDQPVDSFGLPLWEGVLQAPVAAGSVQIIHNGIDPAVAQIGTLLYLEVMTSGLAALQWEAPEIIGVQPPLGYSGTIVQPLGFLAAPGTIQLAVPLVASYPAGTYLAVVPQPLPSAYRILSLGMVIQIPAVPRASSVLAQGQTGQFIDLFGTDILLDPNGFFLSDGQGGIQTVSGDANLKQALQIRLEVEQGELADHPAFGNPLISLIGQRLSGLSIPVAMAMAAQVAGADPRVRSSHAISIYAPQADALSVVLDLEVVGVSGSVNLALQAPLLGSP